MELKVFSRAFHHAVDLAAPHVHKERGHKLSGSEMAFISEAAQTAGFERPTPQLIDAIARCTHVKARQRREIIASERDSFFGLQRARLPLEEIPGAMQALVHDTLPLSLELATARVVAAVHGLDFRF